MKKTKQVMLSVEFGLLAAIDTKVKALETSRSKYLLDLAKKDLNYVAPAIVPKVEVKENATQI